MTLWLGLMNVGEKAGVIGILTRLVSPFFSRLFPEVPRNHPAMGAMLMNFSANALGLDNAATPLGLKAMQGLQELNPDKETASNAQIMFLVLNTAGLTLIPVSIMAIRAQQGAASPPTCSCPSCWQRAAVCSRASCPSPSSSGSTCFTPWCCRTWRGWP
jgi:spore maturation protein SpmA